MNRGEGEGRSFLFGFPCVCMQEEGTSSHAHEIQQNDMGKREGLYATLSYIEYLV